jgi:hypothetical protein
MALLLGHVYVLIIMLGRSSSTFLKRQIIKLINGNEERPYVRN